MNKTTPAYGPMLILSVAMLLWASSFIALKVAFASYSPMFVIWARMMVAGACFVFFIKQFFNFEYRAGDYKLLGLMALLEPCFYFVLEAEALLNTSASQAGTITAILPLLIAVIAFFTLGERITRRQLVGFLLAFAGVIGLSLGSEVTEDAPNPLWGNFLEFLAMCCAACYSVLLKRFSARYSPVFLTAFPAFVGIIFFTPFMLLEPFPTHFDSFGAGAIIYLGAVVTLGAYLCYNYAIARVPVTIAGSFSNLIPVFTVLLAWLLLNETLTMSQLASCALVGVGVLISQRTKKVPQQLCTAS
ncbi:DMT family transporter [Psychrobium sp. 1_MG-2023]|uniref:DMT family transporter n=1 Tax=Psychrobium sp. 1_MG-2023 TaxID=3062624 RepID=UPI000C347655|nr:DMT family transporter [Psychrobium sp. 1_MG-2023]MDP2562955.1 DMT family transporter [Psychrobium sp. 1_MG-2023]PKF54035.1 EamA family transporter [Alteromonadales bacterium alter-6D02]